VDLENWQYFQKYSIFFFRENNANFEFGFDCNGASNPQYRYGVGFVAKVMIELGIICVKILPPAGVCPFWRCRQKCVPRNAFFQEVDVFPMNLTVKTATDRAALMPQLRRRNKLSGGVIIIFVNCLVFAQSTRVMDEQTDRRTLE
jgi:hypothetical protein